VVRACAETLRPAVNDPPDRARVLPPLTLRRPPNDPDPVDRVRRAGVERPLRPDRPAEDRDRGARERVGREGLERPRELRPPMLLPLLDLAIPGILT